MKLSIQFLSIVALSTLTFFTYADEGFYLGLRAATVMVNEDDIDDFKNNPFGVDIKNAGKVAFIVGYDFDNSVSVEVLAGTSTHDVTNDVLFPKQELELGTLALYLAYRSEGKWFYKGKGGLMSRTLELSPAFANQDKDSEGLISLGFGGGFNYDEKLSFEAEYITIEQGIGSFGFNALYHL